MCSSLWRLFGFTLQIQTDATTGAKNIQTSAGLALKCHYENERKYLNILVGGSGGFAKYISITFMAAAFLGILGRKIRGGPSLLPLTEDKRPLFWTELLAPECIAEGKSRSSCHQQIPASHSHLPATPMEKNRKEN